MKTDQQIKALVAIIVIGLVVTLCHPMYVKAEKNQNVSYTNKTKMNLLEIKPSSTLNKNLNSLKIDINVDELKEIISARKKAEQLKKEQEEAARKAEEARKQAEEEQRKAEEAKKQVYDGLTLEELSEKLNRSLNSTLSGKGETFAQYSIELGIDPYLAVAIVMHETGCKWECSNLLKTCNNVGGMKGSGGCGGGAYASFPTLDEGIKSYMNNLYNNYFSQGLNTPESMGPKYAASTTWATQVRTYMNEIKAN